jgi:hypothetical protein
MGNSKGRRRRFGAVRELGSGQWQARYRGPDGLMRPADRTFPSKTDAEVWLTRKEAEILNGDWINPDSGQVPFPEYAATWIEERPNLRPKTVQLYRYLLRRHLRSEFAARPSRRSRKRTYAAGVRTCSTRASARSRSLRRTGFSKPS